MPTVLVTGASRGIGLEFVRQYAEDGWSVIATCRDPEKTESLQKLAKANACIRIERLHVTDPASIKALADALADVAIDILINNAGIYSGQKTGAVRFSSSNKDTSQNLGSLDAGAWKRVLETNTIAPVMVTEALLPHLRRGSERKIVMISSRMGSIDMSKAGEIAYRTSKAALNAAAKNIALTLEPQNITAISMHPGWVKTDMGSSAADIAPALSVTGMRKVIANLTVKNSGHFFSYDGTNLPW